MADRNDGGPAYPYSIHMEGYDRLSFPGMSLRDWFAGQAMAGIVAAMNSIPERAAVAAIIADEDGVTVAQSTAAQAYELADAMLTERDRKEPS